MRVLLFRENCVLQPLSYAKLQRSFSRNLNRFPCRGITAFASFTFRFHELTEARKHEFAVRLHFAGRQVRDLFKELFDLRAFHPSLFGEVVDYFGLSHALLASCCSGHGLVGYLRQYLRIGKLTGRDISHTSPKVCKKWIFFAAFAKKVANFKLATAKPESLARNWSSFNQFAVLIRNVFYNSGDFAPLV